MAGVRLTGDALWRRLRELDDPDHLERPADFDRAATAERFEMLVERLERVFRCRCTADPDEQDASFWGTVRVPAEATRTGAQLVVCVSNFGSLVTVSVENPGAYDAEETAVLLDPEDEARVEGALDHLGYVVVPEQELWRDYDGPSEFIVGAGHGGTWWTRFFDWF